MACGTGKFAGLTASVKFSTIQFSLGYSRANVATAPTGRGKARETDPQRGRELVAYLNSRSHPHAAIVVPNRSAAGPVTCRRRWRDVDRSRSVIIAWLRHCRAKQRSDSEPANDAG